MSMNPHLQEALTHGLLGAAGWGGFGALTGALEAEPGERGRGALHGGLTGAALGGLTHGAVGGLGSIARQEAAYAQSARNARAGQSARGSAWDTGANTHDPNWDAGMPWEKKPPRPGAGPRAGASGFNRDPGFWEDYARNSGRGRAKAENMGEQGLHEVAPWLKDVSSKADAKRAYRAQARSVHPDAGGTDRAMQDVNAQWDRAQAHPAFSKLSHAQARGQADALARFGVTR
jgi:hypothetical protein